MKKTHIIGFLILMLVLAGYPAKPAVAYQQPIYPVSFSVNPSIFATNSNVSTLACVTVTGPSNSIAIHHNDTMTFVFDPSVGTVSLPVSPTVVLTTSAGSPTIPPSPVAGDFSVSLGSSNPNKLIIQFTNATTENLVYGTNICTQVNLATAGTPGPAVVRFSSQLATTTGNLPSTSVTLVDFPTGNSTSFGFVSNIVFPSLGSFFMPPNALGDPSGQNTGAGNGDGFITGAVPMPGTCTFNSLRVAVTTGGGPAFPYTFTVWKNDSPTSLACNLNTDTGTATVTCADTTDQVPVVAGDLISIKVDQPGFTCCTPYGNAGIALNCK